MADLAEMQMPIPKNSIPMRTTRGKHDVITMGGMFTILKVRDGLTAYEDPGWYDNPPETVATNATDAELAREGVTAGGSGPENRR